VRLTHRFLHLVAIAPILVGATIAAAGPSGAIFTTISDGSFVNANVYEAKEDVYLNGGPQANKSCSAAGLPDGDYVFQVTDPSGHMLLSQDDVEDRLVRVQNGVIIKDYPNISVHQLLPGRCGGVTVQLMPFDDTDNPGGEYKVWLTPYSELGQPGNVFLHNKSKTDNFKVVPEDTIPD
jgi:hypothetical protein